MKNKASTLAPVILFVYNRADLTEKTLKALANNDLAPQSRLYVFSDGPKAGASPAQKERIQAVRTLIRRQQWCGEVIITEAEENLGLANSIINGVSKVINQHGKAIILEDDIITARGFLTFINQALEVYEKDQRVFGVTGFRHVGKVPRLHDSFFLPVMSSNTWATWEDRWQTINFSGSELVEKIQAMRMERKFNFKNYPFFHMLERQVRGEIDSWAIRFYASMFLREGVFLFPYTSLIKNIGYQLDATHSVNKDIAESIEIGADYVEVTRIPIAVDPRHVRAVQLDFPWWRRKWNGLRRRSRKLLGLPPKR